MRLRGDHIPFQDITEGQRVWLVKSRLYSEPVPMKTFVVWIGSITFRVFGYPNQHFDRRTLLEVTKLAIPNIIYLSEEAYLADIEQQKLLVDFFEAVRFPSRVNLTTDQVRRVLDIMNEGEPIQP